ncbi:MAG: phage portal protein [Pseudomonadota bacterium]
MGILDRLRRRERRSNIKASDPSLDAFFGARGAGGAPVDPERASGLAVAQACITVISQNLAAMPLNVYQRSEGGARERATAHPLHRVLHDQMAEGLTAFEGREALISDLLTAGNAYAEIETNGRGQITALRPVPARWVSVEETRAGRLRYRITDRTGIVRVRIQGEMLHLRYRLDADGALGASPIQLARQAFSLALTQQRHAQRHAEWSFRPQGALVFPQSLGGTLGDGERRRIFSELSKKLLADTDDAGIMVLDGGAEWRSLSFSPKDAEFLESRKLSNLEIARVFNVPPTAVGIVDAATYSNVEGETRALVTRCLAPMARRIEQAMNAALFTPDGRRRHFIEHDMGALLRGDLGARYEAYRVGREAGFLSVNEIRRMENLPPVEEGDTFMQPLNFTRLGGAQLQGAT